MTQRAKLRRLAFIELPSWSRGSRPYSSRREGIPRRLHYNLGADAGAAKGTTQDYLTYLSGIPVQIMALEWVFSGVVKNPLSRISDRCLDVNPPDGGGRAPARC